MVSTFLSHSHLTSLAPSTAAFGSSPSCPQLSRGPRARPVAAMAMKYMGAYLMAVLGGKERPTKKDITAILEAGGISYEAELIEMLCARMDGKDLVVVGKPFFSFFFSHFCFLWFSG